VEGYGGKKEMSQLAAVVPKDRACRFCDKINPPAYIEVEGVVIVVTKAEPRPFGGSVLIGRSIFCNMKHFSEWMRQQYMKDISGKEGNVSAK
jgi:hypothetical protein